jgi:putative FmdB family regulatory protein
MPLYEYKCAKCQEVCEALQKVGAKPLEKCPKCGGGPMVKRVSSPAIQFKGNGWYITDYAKKNSTPAGHPEEKKSKPAAKSESKSETGPTAPPDSDKSSS